MTRPLALDGALAAEIVGTEALDALAAPWLDLESRALDATPFASQAAGTARLRHLPADGGTRLLLAWRGTGTARLLVGLLPLARPRGRFLNPFPLRRVPDLYAPLSIPLLDADRPAETWAAMLAALRRAGIHALALPFLPDEGATATALREAAHASDLPLVRLDGHDRALLRTPLDGAGYLRATFDRARVRDFDRKRRRLAELGPVSFAVARSREEVEPAFETFLALESAGWKGTAGTDLATAPGAANYFRSLAREGARSGSVRVYSMAVGSRTVAAGFVLTAGRGAWFVKTAYDETLAKCSPGVLLTLDITAHLLDDPEIEVADSVAVADHPMIDRIWTERLPVSSCLVATTPGGGALFRGALAAERWRERAVAFAKGRRDGKRPPAPSPAG